MNKEIFGNNLRLVRISLGFSQEQAAELCGISEKTLGKIERGQVNFSVETINRIEEGMCLSLSDLIEGNISLESGYGAWEYYSILEPCTVPGSPVQYSYGIMVCKNTSKGLFLISAAHDVTTIQEFALEIVQKFNSYQLSPVHLMDALQDEIP